MEKKEEKKEEKKKTPAKKKTPVKRMTKKQKKQQEEKEKKEKKEQEEQEEKKEQEDKEKKEKKQKEEQEEKQKKEQEEKEKKEQEEKEEKEKMEKKEEKKEEKKKTPAKKKTPVKRMTKKQKKEQEEKEKKEKKQKEEKEKKEQEEKKEEEMSEDEKVEVKKPSPKRKQATKKKAVAKGKQAAKQKKEVVVSAQNSTEEEKSESEKEAAASSEEKEKEEEEEAMDVKQEAESEDEKMDVEEEAEVKEEPSMKEEPKSPVVKAKPATFSFFGGQKAPKAEIVYRPDKTNSYHPIDDACWKKGEKIPYMALAQTFKLIEETPGRIKLMNILRNFYRSVIVLSPDELVKCVYLSLNRLAPAYKGVELGIGDKLLVRAISESTDQKVMPIYKKLKQYGDLGIVAEKSKSGQKLLFQPTPLTIEGVFAKMEQIAYTSATSGGQGGKLKMINSMLKSCKSCESRYLIRTLVGKGLRIGLAEQSILVSLAHALAITPPGQEYPAKVLHCGKKMSAEKLKDFLDEKTDLLKNAYCEMPNFDVLVDIIYKHGFEGLPIHCKLTPGIPLKPMLANPTSGVTQVLDRFEGMAFTCEYKYDGERAQIHLLENGEVHIYSRNQENNTSKYPDIVKRIPLVIKEGVKSCVIDSEAVAWDTEKKQILPFQVLTTRKKKDCAEAEIKVQVCIYAFDLLYLNGEALVRKSFRERRKLLHDTVLEKEGEFVFATSQDTTDTEEIQSLLDLSVKGNCEGLMVKTLDKEATYEIAKRSHNWLKLKKDYLDGCGDTLDLVVIGAMYGKGRRAGVYGNFLLACYDEETQEYQTICKIGTGFNDQDLATHHKFFSENVISEPKSYYRTNGVTMDEWFEPVQVWEVKAADLSISPVYMAAAGLVDPEKGISLRFPRFLKIRDDKKPEDATSSSQVADFYENQQQIENQKKSKGKSSAQDYY